MNLVIVESPTKAKTLSRFLGGDYQVESTMGHIRDLPERALGVAPEEDFAPKYVLVPKKKERVAELKKLAKVAEKIYLATDPDREGEAIAWHVAQILGETKKPKNEKTEKQSLSSSVFKFLSIHRIVFHQITREAVMAALKNPGEVNMQLVDAQQARRVLDRLVGYKLSPLLWRKVRRGLSAGRVQSVTVRLIVEREREIEKFVPEEYWDISAELAKKKDDQPDTGATFLAKLVGKNGKKLKIGNEPEAKEATDELGRAGYEVREVEEKETTRSARPPFITSTMQQEAANKLRFSARRSMSLAQRLYEEGLISYHRTDSTNLAKEALAAARDLIKDRYGAEFLPAKPNFYKTRSKVAQEAHEAIRPTDVFLTAEADKVTALGRESRRLYELIWRRFIASQMKPAVFDQTEVAVQAVGEKNIYILSASGRVMKFAGWSRAYEKSTVGRVSVDGEDVVLPDLAQGEDLALLDLKSEQKFTQPPPRYTEATLIRALEERGIGRPSTYAPILTTIQQRQYVEKQEGRFHPTPLGVTVNDFLLEYFPGVFDYDFTAKMEADLDEIANGKREWVPVVRDFYQPFNNRLTGVYKAAERVQVPAEATGQTCPKCGQGQVVIRVGKFGKFLACSRFPDCDYTAAHIEKVEGMVCPECGSGDVIIKKTRKGKRFYGCSRYPSCRWASWRKPKVPKREVKEETAT